MKIEKTMTQWRNKEYKSSCQKDAKQNKKNEILELQLAESNKVVRTKQSSNQMSKNKPSGIKDVSKYDVKTWTQKRIEQRGIY